MLCRAISLIVSKPVSRKYLIILSIRRSLVTCNYTCTYQLKHFCISFDDRTHGISNLRIVTHHLKELRFYRQLTDCLTHRFRLPKNIDLINSRRSCHLIPIAIAFPFLYHTALLFSFAELFESFKYRISASFGELPPLQPDLQWSSSTTSSIRRYSHNDYISSAHVIRICFKQSLSFASFSSCF